MGSVEREREREKECMNDFVLLKEAYFYCLNHLFRVYIPLVPLFNATLLRVISQRIFNDVLKKLYDFISFQRSNDRASIITITPEALQAFNYSQEKV